MKTSILIKSALAATTALSAVPAFAQSSDENVEEIVVTAGRRAQPLNEVAKSISVISATELLDRQYVFVADALQDLAGVSLNQTGSFGGSASISIRGNATDQTVILIDGVQINDASSPGGGFNFANLDPNGIERIEVLKGPQAVLYGSDAIGGVVNIITKSGQDGLGGNAYAEYGSYNSLRTGGTIYGGTEKLSATLSASYTDSDGISAADSANGNTEDDGYKNLTLRTKVTAKLSEAASLEFTANYIDSENEFDSFGPVDGLEVGESEEAVLAARGFFDFLDGRWSNTVSIEYSEIDRENFNDGTPTFSAKGERLNLDYINTFQVTEDLSLTSGAQHEEFKSEGQERLDINSVFGLLAYDGIEGLVVSGGVRVDDHETFGSTTNFEANASYTFEETGTQFTAAWGEGFKAPTIFHLTFACCGFEANPNLDPEQSESFELGFKQPLFDGKANFGATYFNQTTDDLIIFTFTNGYQNVSRTRSRGVELNLDAALTDTLDLSASYTFTAAKDRETDLQLDRRPRSQAFAALAWQATERFKTNVSLTYNGSETDRGSVLDNWVRFDVRASYQLKDNIEIYGRIDNLFDAEYQSVIGYGTPGASVFGGFRITL